MSIITTVCKSVQLLTYFGETDLEPCGICSVCISKKKERSKPKQAEIKDNILGALKEQNFSSRELTELVSSTDAVIKKVLTELLEDDLIEITKTNTYKLK